MQRLIADRQDEVLDSWQTLYDRQRDILTWPVKELKQDFVDEFKDLIPIEMFVEFPTEPLDEKETTLLTRYEMYIKNVLPDIAKIAKTEWTAEFEASSASMDIDDGRRLDDGGMAAWGRVAPGDRRYHRRSDGAVGEMGCAVASHNCSRTCSPGAVRRPRRWRFTTPRKTSGSSSNCCRSSRTSTAKLASPTRQRFTRSERSGSANRSGSVPAISPNPAWQHGLDGDGMDMEMDDGHGNGNGHG